MHPQENNYAFIDAQNLHLGIKELGWKLDWSRFRVYLKDKYRVTLAYVFIGYVASNAQLYSSLQQSGYVIVFKPTLPDRHGKVKGNIDADMVLQAMIDFLKYDKAVLISSDGDFYSLVKYLYEQNKLRIVLSPHIDTCSSLLKINAREKIEFIDSLRGKVEYKRKSTA